MAGHNLQNIFVDEFLAMQVGQDKPNGGTLTTRQGTGRHIWNGLRCSKRMTLWFETHQPVARLLWK